LDFVPPVPAFPLFIYRTFWIVPGVMRVHLQHDQVFPPAIAPLYLPSRHPVGYPTVMVRISGNRMDQPGTLALMKGPSAGDFRHNSSVESSHSKRIQSCQSPFSKLGHSKCTVNKVSVVLVSIDLAFVLGSLIGKTMTRAFW
jgi:hypothetical protein